MTTRTTVEARQNGAVRMSSPFAHRINDVLQLSGGAANGDNFDLPMESDGDQ
jgi:hypothetical protein